jgi:SulP family sulfate permease
MSSPVFGFSSWRRRSSSAQSQDSQDGSDAPTVLLASPPQTSAQNIGGDGRQLSSSVDSSTHRDPIRSFVAHGSFRERLAPVDSVQSAQSVREDTAELASYFLSDKKEGSSPSFLSRNRPSFSHSRSDQAVLSDEAEHPGFAGPSRSSETIEEVSEPSSPETVIEDPLEGPSMLANMLKRSPPDRKFLPPPKADQVREEHILDESEDDVESREHHGAGEVHNVSAKDNTEYVPETAPLLTITSRQSWQTYGTQNGRSREHVDLEGQKRQHTHSTSWTARMVDSLRQKKMKTLGMLRTVRDPKCWDRRALWQNIVVAPVACLPAVIVGLLLNILDALSYGMCLFGDFCWSRLTLFRNDSLPFGKPDLRRFGLGRHLDILRQHDNITDNILLWEYFQGWCWFGTDRGCPVLSQHGFHHYRPRG